MVCAAKSFSVNGKGRIKKGAATECRPYGLFDVDPGAEFDRKMSSRIFSICLRRPNALNHKELDPPFGLYRFKSKLGADGVKK